ncbi:NucA/NucB deoxyribonuclease domain-containing protein [Lentzea sp. NPDC051213]|uniref:NucA/NucB deoxyribonuclease domain-containing protein n=1 Tax=Lentzea sp. NPDC051213 TaxID=3364126 RepID=UPI0037B32BF0
MLRLHRRVKALLAGLTIVGSTLAAAPFTAAGAPDVVAATQVSLPPLVITTSDDRLAYITRKPGRFRHVELRGVGGESAYHAVPVSPEVDVRNAAVVETNDGGLQLFSNKDGTIWTTKQQGRDGAWSAWVSLGGKNLYALPPAVARGRGGALWLFATGTDGAVWARSQRGADWSPWFSLGGKKLDTSPSAARGVGDALEVVASASNGAVWKAAQRPGGDTFAPWERISEAGFANNKSTDPQVITRPDRSLEVVVRRADGHVAAKRQAAPGGSWSAWTTFDGHAGVGQPAVILEPDGALTVLSATNERKIFRGRFGVDPASGARTTGNTWQDFSREGAPPIGDSKNITGTALANGSWVAAYIDTDRALAEINSGGVGEPAATPAAPAPPLRDLAAVRADQGSRFSEGYPTAAPPATAAGWTPPPLKYEHFTFEQCRDTADGPPAKEGITKNHYSFCWAGTAAIHFKTNCWLGGLICVGRRIVYTATTIADGSTHFRQAHYSVHLTNFEDDTPVDAVMRIRVDMRCDPVVHADDCNPDNSMRSVERSIAEWKVGEEARMRVVGDEPPRTPSNPDALGFGNAWIFIEATAPGNSKRSISTPKNRVRFDSAEYLKFTAYTGGQGGIFPDAKPVLNFPVNTPEFAAMKESAAHYKQATEHPETTIPSVVGKSIPGIEGKGALHRLFYDQQWRTENADEARRTCRGPEFPPGSYPKPDHDCDEYPFQTTQEGASPNHNPLRNFSVKVIPSADNQAAGTWIGAWYAYDRIVDGDAFHIRVTM